jgi:hypothetical protein
MCIGRFTLHLITGISDVQAERDSANGPARDEAPPVMPIDLVKMRTGKFISDILDPYREHVCKFWSEEDVEKIENDHIALIKDYNSANSWAKQAIRDHDHSTMFNAGWSHLQGKFEHLQAFCGGLASAFANTTSVESDFSILKWEKDASRTGLMDLSLEGIFQAKQYEILANL